MLDLNLKEEEIIGGRLTIIANAQGEICAIHKGGAGGLLHFKVIGSGYVSLTFTKTYKNDYPLLEPFKGYDPSITTIGNAKRYYIFLAK